jgi:MFS family permease
MVSTPALLRARISVLVIFFVHGAVFSTWVSRIPAVQSALRLSTGVLGFALLGIAAGSMISMPLAGWLIARHGSKLVTVVSSLWFGLALALPSAAQSAWTLGLALSLLGLSAGAMDVAMNAQGAEVEHRARKPMMSGFHAMFSIGGMFGAAAGGGLAKAGIPVAAHFLSASGICLLLVLAVIPGLLPAVPDGHSGRARFRLTPAIFGLSAISFCFFLSEGAVADWSALYLAHSLGAGPAQAASGYAFFSAAMAAGRLLGDTLRSRFGAVSLLRNGSVLAASGLALALVVARTPAALLGFTLVGFGCSIIVPIAFAAAGRLSQSLTPSALPTVVASGYFGLFVGPPLIGLVAEAVTLRWALFLVVALCLTGAILARAASDSHIHLTQK